MFRRPKKPIRPRVIMINGEEEDDGDMDYEESKAENNPVAPSSQILKTEKIKEEVKVPKKSTLLSFNEENDEEEDEIFKVKKSSVSRRLMKERKKKETKPKKSDTKQTTTTEKEEDADESILKVTNFVRILTGREAEAVDMESSDEDDDTHVKFKPRPAADAVSEVLRRTLEKEQIPDANLIHEIRKKRQMARDGGTGGAPFIPVDDSITYKPSKSRLIREDENDQSEDDDEKRIDFSFDSVNADRERRREVFDAAQDQDRDEQSESDSDRELEEWERQQIRKGVSQAQLQLATQQQDFLSGDHTGNGEYLNLNDPIPTSSSSSAATRSQASRIEDVMGGKTLRSVDSIFKQLSDRLEGLRVTKESHEGELSRLQVEGDLLVAEIDDCARMKQSLSARLRLYQGIHCYVHDLIDCLRCKVPEIQELENRALGLFQAHAEFLMKRRRQDRDDQYEECCSTLRPVPSVQQDREVEEREKRAAERKGRRTRRRKEREAANIWNHNEGLSTDDEELEVDTQKFKTMRESILEAAAQVFADVHDDYWEVDRILQKFLEWRTEDGGAYRDSYVPLCIPKVLSPVIRVQLLYFDPLQDDADIFRSPWMKSLLFFGFSSTETRETLTTDPDVKLVPGVCEKVVIPWIERVVTAEYDPVSTTQTKRLIHLIRKLLSDYTININSKQIHSLLKSVLTKLEDATDKDVFIPMFDTSALMKSSEVNVFASRQFYASVKLLDNICSWTGILSDKHLQTLALDKLMARYIVSSVRLSFDLQEAVKRAQAVVNVLPRVWLNDGEPPHGVRHLIRALLVLVQERTDFSLPMNKCQVEPMAGVLRALGAVKEAEMISIKYA